MGTEEVVIEVAVFAGDNKAVRSVMGLKDPS
jgi:hypothetical protein